MNAYNPYAPNPYLMQAQQPDIGGLMPVFQNIGQQQANQNAALAQQNQLMNQAAQVGGSGGGGMSQLAMAAMLRNQDPNKQGSTLSQYANSIPAILKYGASNVYGGFGQGQVPTTTTGEN